MSYKQVEYYQELGDYAAAYKIAQTDWNANRELKWPRETIAWLLIKMMKQNACVYAKNKFLLQLEEFKALNLPLKDKKLWGAIAWPIRDIVVDSIEMQWFTSKFGDELFEAIREIPFDKPSESYSALVKAFINLGDLWPRLAEFIEWWGLENFTEFDFRRYPANGKLESLAERVFLSYLKTLNRKEGKREPTIAFYEGLKQLSLRSPSQADEVYNMMRRLH